jgi:hypothetical protein
MEDFAWITGGDPELSHVRKIAAGSFGEVHKVWHSHRFSNLDVKHNERRGTSLAIAIAS